MSFLQIILWLSVGYALLGIVLLSILKWAKLPWPIKAGLIVLTSAFYIANYFGTRALLGWSSIDPLPLRFKLLSARVVEPHSLKGDPGAVYLWVEELDTNSFPSGVPRAYRLPYDPVLAERAEAAVEASAEGKPQQGGITAVFGTGHGETAQAAARPTISMISPEGGDSSSGGALDSTKTQSGNQNIVFTPLIPPRMPPKDQE